MAWVVCVLLLKKQNNYMSEVSQVSWKIKRKNLEVFSYVSNLGYETINNKKKKKKGESTFYLPVVWPIYKLPTRDFKIDTLSTWGIIC